MVPVRLLTERWPVCNPHAEPEFGSPNDPNWIQLGLLPLYLSCYASGAAGRGNPQELLQLEVLVYLECSVQTGVAAFLAFPTLSSDSLQLLASGSQSRD